MEKINKPFTFLMTEEQFKKLKLVSFYTGKSIGKMLRMFIDNLPEEKENK